MLKADNACAGLSHHSEIAIYETASHQFVVSIRHVGPPHAGPSWQDAWLADDPRALRAALIAHDPNAAVAFFLNGDLTAAAVGAGRFNTIWRGLLGALFGAGYAQMCGP